MSQTMRAAVFEKPRVITVKRVPVPEIGDDEVLIRVQLVGICGPTGRFTPASIPRTGCRSSPVTSSAERSSRSGRNAKGLAVGDRVTADINMSCGHCFYCKQGQKLLCPEFLQLGIHVDGAYAEYVKAPWAQVHKIPAKLSFLEAAFIEPVSCTIHSAKAMNVALSSSAAIIGCGLGILHGALAGSGVARPSS